MQETSSQTSADKTNGILSMNTTAQKTQGKTSGNPRGSDHQEILEHAPHSPRSEEITKSLHPDSKNQFPTFSELSEQHVIVILLALFGLLANIFQIVFADVSDPRFLNSLLIFIGFVSFSYFSYFISKGNRKYAVRVVFFTVISIKMLVTLFTSFGVTEVNPTLATDSNAQSLITVVPPSEVTSDSTSNDNNDFTLVIIPNTTEITAVSSSLPALNLTGFDPVLSNTTEASTPASSKTQKPTKTITPVPMDTVTPEPTETPIPTETSTPVPTETPAPTETSTPVPTETLVPTETSTPTPTETPAPTETVTPEPTETPIPTETPPNDANNEACSPGYWKNHLSAWGATGFSKYDDFDITFGVNIFIPDITLKQSLYLQGGAEMSLARQGTAALLNAAHPDVDYPLTVAQVIALVQAGDVNTLEEYNNELVCPLHNGDDD